MGLSVAQCFPRSSQAQGCHSAAIPVYANANIFIIFAIRQLISNLFPSLAQSGVGWGGGWQNVTADLCADKG